MASTPHAIFLSYSVADAAPAQRICTAGLLRQPFGTVMEFIDDSDPVCLLVKDDPYRVELINRLPRL